MKHESKRDRQIEEEFLGRAGVSLETVLTLYQRAVEHDWRTVQATAQQVIGKFAVSRAAALETADLLKITRAILANENGEHLSLSGLGDPAP